MILTPTLDCVMNPGAFSILQGFCFARPVAREPDRLVQELQR